MYGKVKHADGPSRSSWAPARMADCYWPGRRGVGRAGAGLDADPEPGQLALRAMALGHVCRWLWFFGFYAKD